MSRFAHPRLEDLLRDLGRRTGSRALEHLPALVAMEAAARGLPVLHLQAAPGGLAAVLRPLDQADLLASEACDLIHEQIRAPGSGRIRACYDAVVQDGGREALLEEKSCVSEDGTLPDEIVLRGAAIDQAAAAIALQADREGLGPDLADLAGRLPSEGEIPAAQAVEVLGLLAEMGPAPALVAVASRDRGRARGMRLLVLEGPAVAAAYAAMIVQGTGTGRAPENVRRILRTAAGLEVPPRDDDYKIGSLGHALLRRIPGILEGGEILDRAEADLLKARALGDRPLEAAGLAGDPGMRALQAWIETGLADGRPIPDLLSALGVRPPEASAPPRVAP